MNTETKYVNRGKGLLNIIENVENTRLTSEESGSGGTSIITKTKAEIDALILANGLVKGQLYEILGVDENWCDVFLYATSTNTLAQAGNGRFFNPNYLKTTYAEDDYRKNFPIITGYEIWTKYMNGIFSGIIGTFETEEIVTANNGATAKYLAGGFIEFISGNWSSATSISGETATATVSGFISPSYAVNDIVIWGGTHWKNLLGNIGSEVDMFNLDVTNWQKITTNLVVEYDTIEYDYSNDLIIARKDKRGNEISASWLIKYRWDNSGVKVFKWGDDNTNLNISNQGYFESVNSLGYFNCNNLASGAYITSNNLASGAYITSNNLASGAYITSNSLADNANFRYNALNNNAYFASNILASDASFYTNTLNNNANFNSNILTSDASFNYNTLANDASFNSNRLESNTTFNHNTLESGASCQANILKKGAYINYNTLAANAIFTSNTLASDAYFKYNTLGSSASFSGNILASNAYFNGNTLGSSASFSYNTLASRAGFSYNTLASRAYFNFGTSITGNIQNITVEGFNKTTNILTATIIYQPYAKKITAREDGNGIITHWNNSNVQIVNNITD